MNNKLIALKEKLQFKPIITQMYEQKNYYGYSMQQIERAYKHIVKEVPMAEIARQEKLSVTAIRDSIVRVVGKMKSCYK